MKNTDKIEELKQKLWQVLQLADEVDCQITDLIENDPEKEFLELVQEHWIPVMNGTSDAYDAIINAVEQDDDDIEDEED